MKSTPRFRHDLITGNPPRIPPLKPSEISKELLAAHNQLRKAVSLPPADEVPEFTATMFRHPGLYESHMAFSLKLFHGALAPRDRELAVLRVAWLCQAPYAWGEHVRIGKQLAGLTDDEVARVTVGSTAPEWHERDRAILQAVEEMHADAMISETTWTILSNSLNEKQLIELPLLVGQYQGTAYLQNSFRSRLAAGNSGLYAR